METVVEVATRIADKHMAGESIERRTALAVEISEAIGYHAGRMANEALTRAFAKVRASQ